jgi:hypothetical protein
MSASASLGKPSLSWSVPSGNYILVQQNPSFRISDGVAIAGAPAAACTLNRETISTMIVIQQEANGLFISRAAAPTKISGGAAVRCRFADIANARVTGLANISPSSAASSAHSRKR